MARHGDKAMLERELAEERARRAREARAGGDEPTGDEPTGDEPTGDEPTGDEPVDTDLVEEKSDEQRALELGLIVEGFEAALRDVFGADEPLVQLEMDGAIGFLLPGAVAFKANDKFRRCQTCNGHGAVLTGSIADGKQTADCPRCAGLGYLTRLEEGQGEARQQVGETGNGIVDPDAGFGVERWMGDPSIGQ